MTKKQNILFMTSNFEDTVCINCYTELERAVAKIANCKWAGSGWPLHRINELLSETVRRVMPKVDWVLHYSFEILLSKMNFRIPSHRKYKVGAYIGDIHRVPDRQIKYINKNGWDALLMLYTHLGACVDYRMNRIVSIDPEYYLKNVEVPIFHMAPCVNPEKFKPTNGEKDIDILFLGALGLPWYPLRTKIFRELPEVAEKYGWKIVMRQSPPGRSLTRKISALQGKHIVGDRYSNIIARSKLFVFGTSVFKYPLLKFPESMACRTCAVSDVPLTAEKLHLVENQNFVSINERNWVQKLKYYLEHDDEREAIAQQGYETYLKHHTTDIRAQQLVQFLEECT